MMFHSFLRVYQKINRLTPDGVHPPQCSAWALSFSLAGGSERPWMVGWWGELQVATSGKSHGKSPWMKNGSSKTQKPNGLTCPRFLMQHQTYQTTRLLRLGLGLSRTADMYTSRERYIRYIRMLVADGQWARVPQFLIGKAHVSIYVHLFGQGSLNFLTSICIHIPQNIYAAKKISPSFSYTRNSYTVLGLYFSQ